MVEQAESRFTLEKLRETKVVGMPVFDWAIILIIAIVLALLTGPFIRNFFIIFGIFAVMYLITYFLLLREPQKEEV